MSSLTRAVSRCGTWAACRSGPTAGRRCTWGRPRRRGGRRGAYWRRRGWPRRRCPSRGCPCRARPRPCRRETRCRGSRGRGSGCPRSLAAGEPRLRPARVPVVPVGDDEHVVVARRAVRVGQPPKRPSARCCDAPHGRPETNVIAEAEVVDVGIEVLRRSGCDAESPDRTPASGSPSTACVRATC